MGPPSSHKAQASIRASNVETGGQYSIWSFAAREINTEQSIAVVVESKPCLSGLWDIVSHTVVRSQVTPTSPGQTKCRDMVKNTLFLKIQGQSARGSAYVRQQESKDARKNDRRSESTDNI